MKKMEKYMIFYIFSMLGVDDSLGEKLVNNVLNNFTTQD